MDTIQLPKHLRRHGCDVKLQSFSAGGQRFSRTRGCELRIYELVKPCKSTTSAMTTLSRYHTWHTDASSTQFHVGQHMKKKEKKKQRKSTKEKVRWCCVVCI